MFYLGNFSSQPGQPSIIGCQRVAAAVNDFTEAGIRAYIVQCLLPLGGAQVVVFVGEVAAKTVAKVINLAFIVVL